MRQRSEQNGRKRFCGVESAGLLQIGQRIDHYRPENCQIAAARATRSMPEGRKTSIRLHLTTYPR